VAAKEGRLLFATTDRYHTLDPALTRPGRIDLHVEFRLASRYQAEELYKRFYFPNASEEIEEDEDEDEASGDSGEEGLDSAPSVLPKNVGGNEEPPPKYNGTAHLARTPMLSKYNVERLAEQFSARIPERELSMASLQGYLMTYTTRPYQVVNDVEIGEPRRKLWLPGEDHRTRWGPWQF
jgi:chaperone BCS1